MIYRIFFMYDVINNVLEDKYENFTWMDEATWKALLRYDGDMLSGGTRMWVAVEGEYDDL